ncbi:MAG: acylphosphatase [Gammaproteobacteria bacterium]|nr:acylphosphatase [Gammaproteobacteria bacterium]
MKQTIHCYVSGRVQGVCFRMETREQAALFGVTGWVRNLADGRVEVFACGDKEKLDHLYEWLKVGPEMARVLDVEIEVLEYQEFDRFSVR